MLTPKDKIIINKKMSKRYLRLVISLYSISLIILSMEVALLTYTLWYTCNEHGLIINDVLPQLSNGIKLDSSYTGVEAALYLTYEELKIFSILLLCLFSLLPLIIIENKRNNRAFNLLKESGLL